MRSRIVRVSCIGSSPELVSNFVDVRASNLEAHGVIKRLGGALARASSSQPIADYLPALEKLLAESHATTSDAFRKPSANVHDVLEALVNEKKIVLSTAKAGGAAAEDGAEQIPRGDAIEAALRAEAFKRVANAVGALNVSERLGRLDTMAAGFDGACVLIVRALCKPIKSSALTARVITPAILNDLHNYVPEYLSWISSRYLFDAVVEQLGQFIRKVLAALGTSAISIDDTQNDGITFAQWTATYVEHLKRVTRHTTVEEQYDFLEHCHELFLTALAKAGSFLRGELYSLLPATRRIHRSGGVENLRRAVYFTVETTSHSRSGIAATHRTSGVFATHN
ncbi:MAG: hypothetical protein SGPRY_011409 [Prymnesium sp.]